MPLPLESALLSYLEAVHMAELDPSTKHVLQYFSFDHLPPHLQDKSKPFSDMANWIIETIPSNPERTVALRKLLECKDAAVRAALPPK